jgi:hypothetical protein
MTTWHETPLAEAGAICFRGPQAKPQSSAAAKGHRHSRSSVRELERIASTLRLAGEYRVSAHIDSQILSLLERKIYRKIIAKSRRERLSKRGAAA